MSQHEYDTEVETADGTVDITIVYTFREGWPDPNLYPADEVELDEVLVHGEHGHTVMRGENGPVSAPYEIFKLVAMQFYRWYDQLCEHARGL